MGGEPRALGQLIGKLLELFPTREEFAAMGKQEVDESHQLECEW